MWLNKHQFKGPSGFYVGASEKGQNLEEGTIFKSKPKVRKIESNEKDSDFEVYDKYAGKPVNVDVDKETTERQRSPTLAL